MFTIKALAPNIGAEISDIDLSQPLSEAIIQQLRQAWLDHLVIFFRDQTLTSEQFLRLAHHFGELSEYPFVKGLDDYPQIVEVIKKEDEIHNFGGVWHSDTTYLEQPPMGSMLYALEIPPVGGDTLFSNMVLAYESLSEGLKQALDGLIAINSSAKPDAAITRIDRKADRPTDASDNTLVAEHPIVRTHPETGRKALYVNPGHSVQIKGWSVEESQPLLQYLFQVQQRAEFCCRFQWQKGSLAFWDNRAAQHYAMNDYHGHRRIMHRITFSGDRPI